MQNFNDLKEFIQSLGQNILENDSLDHLTDKDCSYLDRSLSQLFEVNIFHEIFHEWILLCDLKNLKDLPKLKELCLKLCNGYNQIGNLACNSGDYEISLECYQCALMLCPSSHPFMRSQLLFNRGIVFIKSQDLVNALNEFEAAIANNAQFIPAYYQRERVLYEIESQSKSYHFTHDWFSRNIPLLAEHIASLRGLPNLHFLEIGSWEGRSTCWFIEKVLTHESAQITCIDTFAGESYLNLAQNVLENVEERFDWNIAQTGCIDKVKKYIGRSQDILRNLPFGTYDLIYVDGSHLAIDVISDAVLSWELLKQGGIMVFDDYDKTFPDNQSQNTSIAIDAFINCFQPKLEIIHQSHQVFIKKI